MGAINCKTNAKFAEELKAEADISNPLSQELDHSKAVYKSMTTRVLSSREELLHSVQSGFQNSTKNFDPYYAFLLEQLRSTRFSSLCTTSETALNASSRTNKENVASSKNSTGKKGTRPVRVKSRLGGPATKKIGSTNLYLYVEAPTQGFFSKGGKLKPMVPSSMKNSRVKIKESQLYQTNAENTAAVIMDEKPSPLNDSQLSAATNARTPAKPSFDIISLLPQNVQTLILSYLINQYRCILCVNAVWHSMAVTTLDALFNPLENQLIKRSNACFVFRNSFTQSTVSSTGYWKGTRVDRVIQLELLKGFEGQTLAMSYTYSFVNDRKNVYRTQYKLDCVAKGNRTIWMHNSENVLSGRKYTYSMNIVPICVGDLVEIAINYYTPRGLIDVNSVQWEDITVEKTPPPSEIVPVGLPTARTVAPTGGVEPKTPKQKVDLNRTCELETMGAEWYDSKYYKMTEPFADMREIGQNFIVDSIEFASLDVKACKIRLTAFRAGHIRKELLGISTVVKSYGAECVNEAKRLGLMIDRGGEVQLRTGDTLVLYLSKHHQE